MANPEHVTKLMEGVEAWNKWRSTNGRLAAIDFRGADLSGADLSGANFYWADLTRANLSGAKLRSRTNLSGANLGGANLTRADLFSADLSSANLKWADLTGATLGFSIFANNTLAETKGLEFCEHVGPSSIGIDTFFRSQGQIPEVFLRGCGVPEQFITYARSLVADAIQFYSCFISYSTQDQEFAQRLHADLQARSLRCWFAPEDLKIGDRFQERIEESIRLFDKVMIVLSDASMKSRWVEREVNAAREREDWENRTVLFPIRIDDAVMNAPQPWAADIRRSRHIGDFSRWKDHDYYRKRFDRLLRDLEAKGSAAVQGA